MAGTIGNNNSNRNNRLWGDTIRKACIQSDGETLTQIAFALIAKAKEGDIQAIKELGDRLDGKVAQAVIADVNHTGSVEVVERLIIDHATDTDPESI